MQIAEKPRAKVLESSDWVATAKAMLIEGGVAKISLRSLASKLGVTTGAFYWQFKNLDDLKAAIRKDWAETNTAPFTRIFENPGLSPEDKYLAYASALILEDVYDPHYDNAIRDWSHSDPLTAEILARVDKQRIEQLAGMFEGFGYDPQAALIRARVTYFHQSGYISMRIEESTEERIANLPYYSMALIGKNLYEGASSPHEYEQMLRSAARKLD